MSDHPFREPLCWRRGVFALLVLLIAGGILGLAIAVLAAGGLSPLEGLIVLLVIGTLPWSALCAANAVIGLVICLCSPDPLAAVVPQLRVLRPGLPAGRTAIVVCVRNEHLEAVLPPLARLQRELAAAGAADRFAFWVLSDTPAGPAAEAEEAAFRAFAAAHPGFYYRRRPTNEGYKAGNVMAFLDCHGDDFAYLVCLDADSEMTAAAVLRLIAVLETDAELAIVQQLIHGRPARAAFPRLFQFGMRQGMRIWATGQAWWQGDEGPYWGHNAAIRIAPFRAHARLPVLADGRPVLSHDQVEAARLTAAGWKVRVLPDDSGSSEANPPSFGDFIRRDLRWAAGNMQYFALLRLPGLRPMGRWQLVQAILLFLGAPLWVAIFIASALNGLSGGAEGTPMGALALLMLACWGCLYAPKLAGYAELLANGKAAARYGGRRRVLAGAAAEILFTTLIDPARLTMQTLFLLALPFGGRIGWPSQNRASRPIGWGEAARDFAAPTLLGVLLTAAFAAVSPLALLFAAPFLASLLLAIPCAVLTAESRLSAWLEARRIAAMPEELGR